MADRLRLYSGTACEKPRGQDAGVVDDKHIACVKLFRKLPEGAVLDRTDIAMEHEHPGSSAVRKRLLGNPGGR